MKTVIGIQHIVLAMKPTEGNFSENALKHGVAGINIDGCRIGTDWDNESGVRKGHSDKKCSSDGVTGWGKNSMHAEVNPSGRFPPNVILQENEVISGEFPDTGNNWRKSKGNGSGIGMFGVSGGETQGQNDSGSASRFFKKVQET